MRQDQWDMDLSYGNRAINPREATTMPRLTPRGAGSVTRNSLNDLAWIKPAAKSMYESSLHYRDHWVMPEMKGLQSLQDALDGDAAKQMRKYGGGEPTGDSASFTVRLPQGPQHSKYCQPSRLENSEPPLSNRNSVDAAEPGTPVSSQPPSPKNQRRCNKKEVLHFFREIDRAGSGFVTKRQAIVGLQKHLKPHDVERITGAAKRLDISGREESQMTFGDLLNVFRESGLLINHHSHAELTHGCSAIGAAIDGKHKSSKQDVYVPENMALEIRLRIGPSEEARFRKNKRAGSLAFTDDDGKPCSLPTFALPAIC